MSYRKLFFSDSNIVPLADKLSSSSLYIKFVTSSYAPRKLTNQEPNGLLLHISANAISNASANQVLKFLLYLSNGSLQKTLLPLRRFQAPCFPRGFCEVEIALEFGVE